MSCALVVTSADVDAECFPVALGFSIRVPSAVVVSDAETRGLTLVDGLTTPDREALDVIDGETDDRLEGDGERDSPREKLTATDDVTLCVGDATPGENVAMNESRVDALTESDLRTEFVVRIEADTSGVKVPVEETVTLWERIAVIVFDDCAVAVIGDDDAHIVVLTESVKRVDADAPAERLAVTRLDFVA